MSDLLLYCLVITLKNTAAFIIFRQGMLLSRIRIAGANILDSFLDKKTSKIIQKPLWDCLVCMSSLWTIIWLIIDGETEVTTYINTILVVCGMATIISSLITGYDD